MKLYRVLLRGMRHTMTGPAYGDSYVVADSSDEALMIVQKYVKERDLGFDCEREMETIQLVAEEGDYPGCGVQIHIKAPPAHHPKGVGA